MTVIEREDLPLVAINLLTKGRTDLAVGTIHQVLRHLKYDGELKWFVTDNGSVGSHFAQLDDAIPVRYRLGSHSQSGPIGACWNEGLKRIFAKTDYYIRLEDDMQLKADLDITRYIKAMMEYEFIGMIRLGQMTIGLLLDCVKFRIATHIGYEEDVYFEVDKSRQYAFSGHPALINRSFHATYGYYSTESSMTAGHLEVEMDSVFRRSPAQTSSIYFPWDLGRFGTWGPWDHKGTQKA